MGARAGGGPAGPGADDEVAATALEVRAGTRPGVRAGPDEPEPLTRGQEARNLAILWAGCYLTSCSWSLVIPFLPILMSDLGVSSAHLSAWTGLAFSAAFATAVFASPVWGAWADAVGKKPNLLRSGVAITVVMIGLANVHSPQMVLVWRLLNGLLSGFIPASFALVAATVPSARLGRSLGFLQTGPAAGAITGPLIGGALVQLWGIHWTFYLAAAAQLAATTLVLLVVREPAPPRRGMRLEMLQLLGKVVRNPGLRLVLLITVLAQLATTIIEPLITIYVGQFPGVGAVPLLAGLLFSLVGIATVAFAPLWGRRGERRGYGGVVLLGLGGAAVGNALQLAAGSLWVFGAIRFVTGAAYAGANTGLAAWAATTVEDSFRGRAYGFLTSSQQVGNLLGPLVGGVWGDSYGIRSSFGLSALVFALALGLLALALGRWRHSGAPGID